MGYARGVAPLDSLAPPLPRWVFCERQNQKFCSMWTDAQTDSQTSILGSRAAYLLTSVTRIAGCVVIIERLCPKAGCDPISNTIDNHHVITTVYAAPSFTRGPSPHITHLSCTLLLKLANIQSGYPVVFCLINLESAGLPRGCEPRSRKLPCLRAR